MYIEEKSDDEQKMHYKDLQLNINFNRKPLQHPNIPGLTIS